MWDSCTWSPVHFAGDGAGSEGWGRGRSGRHHGPAHAVKPRPLPRVWLPHDHQLRPAKSQPGHAAAAEGVHCGHRLWAGRRHWQLSRQGLWHQQEKGLSWFSAWRVFLLQVDGQLVWVFFLLFFLWYRPQNTSSCLSSHRKAAYWH